MKLKGKITLMLVFILVFVAGFVVFIPHIKIYRILEYSDLQKNSLNVDIEDKDQKLKNVQIKWIGEKERPSKLDLALHHTNDTIVIYSNLKNVNHIPDRYGKNKIIIEYDNRSYSKIGILKFRGWYKHNYNINLKVNGSYLIIDWEIKNLFEETAGNDSLLIF